MVEWRTARSVREPARTRQGRTARLLSAFGRGRVLALRFGRLSHQLTRCHVQSGGQPASGAGWRSCSSVCDATRPSVTPSSRLGHAFDTLPEETGRHHAGTLGGTVRAPPVWTLAVCWAARTLFRQVRQARNAFAQDGGPWKRFGNAFETLSRQSGRHMSNPKRFGNASGSEWRRDASSGA